MGFDNKKKLIGIAVLAIIFVLLAVFKANSNKQELPQNPVVNNENSVAANPATTTPEVKPVPAKPVPKLTYTQAVEQYKDKRIQFDPNCQAIPSYITFKNPVTIMLDNRSNVARKILLNGKTYSIGAYGFAIATINSKTLPAELPLKCDAQYNVGRILMQK